MANLAFSKVFLFLIFALSGSLVAPNFAIAQSESEDKSNDEKIEEIIDNFVQGFGGEMQVLSYDTMKISMEATRKASTFSWEVGYDDELIYSDTSSGNHLRVFSEKNAWVKTRGDWSLEKESLHETGIYAFPHYLTVSRIANMADEFKYKGEESVDCPLTDATYDTHVLELKTEYANARQFLFDKESGRLVSFRHVFEEGKQNEYFYEFGPCEELDGKQFLTREYVTYSTGVQMTVVVNNVEVDVELPAELIECPAPIKEAIRLREKAKKQESQKSREAAKDGN